VCFQELKTWFHFQELKTRSALGINPWAGEGRQKGLGRLSVTCGHQSMSCPDNSEVLI
jgi:hypothetical protein